MSDEFGATAWGHGWLRLAEPTTITRPDPALPRARTLARHDRVRDVDTAPGRVAAVVDDGGEHRVHLTLPVWGPVDRERAMAALAGHAGTDDLPDTVHAELRGADVPVTPSPDELTATCSCTARRAPCVHILAAYLELSRRLDERPVLALLLRGATGRPRPADAARVPLDTLDPATFYLSPTAD